eukprot:NODE_187_length_1239_cov_334.448741_g183_i0.p1 GENE.NODE_187_length_1239_cov_334.448741_g183_i0~~NODE_187_length_1239_cov_334.448741_g183_i0.p1  ORF type:complete len:354 (-),score=100.26 NODE_187_length_1239_cov_334.448741_g183_i0:176-1189(-)
MLTPYDSLLAAGFPTSPLVTPLDYSSALALPPVVISDPFTSNPVHTSPALEVGPVVPYTSSLLPQQPPPAAQSDFVSAPPDSTPPPRPEGKWQTWNSDSKTWNDLPWEVTRALNEATEKELPGITYHMSRTAFEFNLKTKTRTNVQTGNVRPIRYLATPADWAPPGTFPHDNGTGGQHPVTPGPMMGGPGAPNPGYAPMPPGQTGIPQQQPYPNPGFGAGQPPNAMMPPMGMQQQPVGPMGMPQQPGQMGMPPQPYPQGMGVPQQSNEWLPPLQPHVQPQHPGMQPQPMGMQQPGMQPQYSNTPGLYDNGTGYYGNDSGMLQQQTLPAKKKRGIFGR